MHALASKDLSNGLHSLFLFAWAFSTDEKRAAELISRVMKKCRNRSGSCCRCTELEHLARAYQLFSGGRRMATSPPHKPQSELNQNSWPMVDHLESHALLECFRELDLPLRATLILFYTARISIEEIGTILRLTSDEVVAIISNGRIALANAVHRSQASSVDALERNICT